jgi:hypothetical protein
MASSSSTETYTTPPQSSHSHNYVPQYTPPTNPSTAAPLHPIPQTSPHTVNTTLHQLPMPTRQLRPPKSPLYRPAVLRPTERPWRQGPMSPPPSSSAGSVGSMNSDDGGSLGRVSTGESANTWGLGKVAEVDWICDEGSGEVTGLPTRAHWQVSGFTSYHSRFPSFPYSALMSAGGAFCQQCALTPALPTEQPISDASKLPCLPPSHSCARGNGISPPFEKTVFRSCWGSRTSLMANVLAGDVYVHVPCGRRAKYTKTGPAKLSCWGRCQGKNVLPIL